VSRAHKSVPVEFAPSEVDALLSAIENVVGEGGPLDDDDPLEHARIRLGLARRACEA